METTQVILGIEVNINTYNKATNFDYRISKEEAERLLLQHGKFLPFEIMCKEYGQDEDWIGLTSDDLHETPSALDKNYQTFEIWAGKDKEQKEFITYEDGDEDNWVCICGNTPSDGGFDICDKQGNVIEPLIGSDWDNLYRCAVCGRIIDQRNHEVVGINLNPTRWDE
jgi:hypothetical protein